MRSDFKKIKIQVEGMTCANCAAGIKKHLINKGLEDVNVNFSTGEASCNINTLQNQNDVENIIQKLFKLYGICNPFDHLFNATINFLASFAGISLKEDHSLAASFR